MTQKTIASSKDQNNNPSYHLALFEGVEIRRVWHNNEWYFSIRDIVQILAEPKNLTDYIKKLRIRDKELAKGWGQIVTPLSIQTPGGPQKTNCAATSGVLRIIQSIPSKKAEPFKLWLAQVGKERIDEIRNPELAAQRMRHLYIAKGYPDDWIEQRERGIVTRNNLTAEWDKRGAKAGRDYAILTNEIYRTGFGVTAKEYKNIKNLGRQDNLRDSMTNIELALTNLGEVTATELHKKNDSYGMPELKSDTKTTGHTLKKARQEVEKALNEPVIKPDNYKNLTDSNPPHIDTES